LGSKAIEMSVSKGNEVQQLGFLKGNLRGAYSQIVIIGLDNYLFMQTWEIIGRGQAKPFMLS